MATNAFIGGWTLKRGDGAGPEVFTTVEEVISLSDVGKTRATEEVTHFSSPAGTKEFISGLAEGDEVSFECNYLQTGNTVQQALIADIDTSTVTSRNFEVDVTDGTGSQTLSFASAPVSWKVNPNQEGSNTISFTFKISGDITTA